MESNKRWLNHLEGSIPPEAYGYRVSMYSIALEGWRRGLTLKFKNNTESGPLNRYSLTYKGREHHFSSSRGDKVSRKAINICVSKHLTKKRLAKANVPIPEGKTFKREVAPEDIVNYANSLGYPLVLKPSVSSGGRGVIANIENEEAFRKALTYIREELNYAILIVEKFIVGEDYRIYIVNNTVVGAISRKAAHIIGNGTDSVKVLIGQKNKERDLNPALYNSPIRIDDELWDMLRLKAYTLDSIPKQDETVVLKTKDNVSAGGDPIDITDELPGEIKDIALEAVKAIPDLAQVGVDIMFDKKENKGAVLEVNSKPSIRTHLFPMIGNARDIPKAIIDYYFPETTHIKETQNPYYFDVKHMIDNFQSGILEEVVVPAMPCGDLSATEFTVPAPRRITDARWIREKARKYRLNGYTEPIKDGKLIVVVSGSSDAVSEFRNLINKEFVNIEERNYEHPVKIGFEIEEKKQRPYQKDYEEVKKERDFYKKEYQAIKNSKAWRATGPIRSIGSFTKSKINTEK